MTTEALDFYAYWNGAQVAERRGFPGGLANDKTNEGPDACRSLHLISIP